MNKTLYRGHKRFISGLLTFTIVLSGSFSAIGESGVVQAASLNSVEGFSLSTGVEETTNTYSRTIEDSQVNNVQIAMPATAGALDVFEVHPYGHRLMVSQTDTKASVSSLTNLSYYLFDATTEAASLEADIVINSVGSSSSNGVFFGMFDTTENITNIATLAMRGDGKVRNVYTKAGATTPSAGSIEQVYTKGDTLHLLVKRTSDGWVSNVTIDGTKISSTIKYSASELLEDINTEVRYGIAFANVDAVIKNLTYTGASGEVLYSQNDCYEAIGTAPTVTKVETPVVSDDKTSLSVSWTGDTCTDDASYKVELSSDNGVTYKTLANDVTTTSFTSAITQSGEYCFRISGICASKTTDPVTSASVKVALSDGSDTDDTGLSGYSLTGYASADQVTGGGILAETSSQYFKVSTADEFLSAISSAKTTAKPTVIELTNDISLGSIEIGDSLTTYSSIIKAHKNQALLHPTLIKTGVSMLYIKEMNNLTIFSQNGSSIKHACMDVNNSSNIIIKNIVFDELWEWDEGYGTDYEAGEYDRNDWDYVTIQNGSTGIWIDHCTFYKSYDGIVDVKKASAEYKTNVTISWSKFLPKSEGSFFDDMMSLLEANPENYTYYNTLLTDYDMTKEQIRGYASGQKKTHLVGASDTEANFQNLQLTLYCNYYKDSMDRMPRLRGGNAHITGCIMDSEDLYNTKMSITNSHAASKIVSNGALSTCNAHVLLENTLVKGIVNPALSGNMASAAGYINARNCAYYLNGVEETLTPVGNRTTGEDPLLLDIDAFVAELPYTTDSTINPYNLETTVLPFTGAGTVTMSVTQWEKTVYNADKVDETPATEVPSVTEAPVVTASPTEAPVITESPSTPEPTVEPTATAKPVTVNTVTGLKMTSSTAKTATISWNKQTDQTGFVITYKNAANKTVTKNVKNTVTTYKLTDLAPNGSYKVSVKAYKTVNGTNTYSDVRQITVKTTALKAVTGLKASKTATSITLSFNKVSEANGYVITYTNPLGKKATVTLSSASKTTTTIKKLVANKSYTFKVKSFTTVNGKKYYGNEQKIKVIIPKATAPGKVTSFKVTKASKTSFTVKVGAVKGADGYEVSYSLKKNAGYKKLVLGSKTKATAKQLKSKKTYYVKVRSYKTIYTVSKGKVVAKKLYSKDSTIKKISLK